MVKTTVMGCICVTTARGVALRGRGQVTGIDQAETDPAGDGRGDVGKAQLHLVELQSALIGFDRSSVLQDDLLLIVQRLFGDGIARPGVLVALQVHFRLGRAGWCRAPAAPWAVSTLAWKGRGSIWIRGWPR